VGVPALLAGGRIDSLDLLRGIAILGIFLMNTQSMSMPQDAYTNPAAYSPEYLPGQGFPPDGESLRMVTGLNYVVYVIVHLLADMKFITIFSMMFGAGIVLQSERAARRGRNPWGVHYARMAVLLLFGLLHAYGLWYGDILVSYAICGIVLAPLRKLPAAVLSLLGIVLIGTVSFISLADIEGWHFRVLQQLQLVSSTLYHGGINQELEAYRAGWWHQMNHRAWESLRAQSVDFLMWTFLRCGGCMLLGMALHRVRFFQGAWTRGAYAMLAAFLIPIGWVLSGAGVLFNQEIGWSQEYVKLFSVWGLGAAFNYWGSLLSALGYMCGGVLLAMWGAAAGGWLLQAALVPIRAVGRTALSNYILQSVVGTTLFYGHGFGLFGRLSRAELLIVVTGMWVVQLIISPLWLRYFRQGPLEWLWHFLVYGKAGRTGEPPGAPV
jgi:uncharacterized protein